MKRFLYKLYQRLVNLLWGTGLGKIPPIYWVYSFTFKLLRPSKEIMEIEGSKMYSSAKNLPVGYNRTFQAYIVKEGWEPEMTRLFKELAKEGSVIVDIGANIGYYTLLSAKIVGSSGTVYAFEPDPINYKILTSNIQLNNFTNIITEQKAVSDKIGTLNLHLDSKDMGAHTIYETKKRSKTVAVESVTLDKYFEGNGQPIDIIKMDIEGAEMAALIGMENILKKNKDLKLFIEFFLPWIRRAGVSPEHFASLLFGYYKFKITVIEDYTRNIKSEKVENASELLSICEKVGVVNLLLERE